MTVAEVVVVVVVVIASNVENQDTLQENAPKMKTITEIKCISLDLSHV